jgi:hypothetical protein
MCTIFSSHLLLNGGASINALYFIYALKIMYLFDFEPDVFVSRHRYMLENEK